MRILGIDPGLAIVGWGVIDYEKSKFHTVAYGSLQTPAGIPTERRLALIYDGMKQLIEKYSPEVMSIEELFFSTNVTTGIRVAEARGVLLLAAEQAGMQGHIAKPIDLQKMMETIRTVLHRKG